MPKPTNISSIPVIGAPLPGGEGLGVGSEAQPCVLLSAWGTPTPPSPWWGKA